MSGNAFSFSAQPIRSFMTNDGLIRSGLCNHKTTYMTNKVDYFFLCGNIEGTLTTRFFTGSNNETNTALILGNVSRFHRRYDKSGNTTFHITRATPK